MKFNFKCSILGEEWDYLTESKRNKYYLSNYGRVLSLDQDNKERLLNCSRDNYGFVVLNTRTPENKRLHSKIHYEVAERWLDQERLDFLRHKDGNKENNHVDNLEWITKEELYATFTGTPGVITSSKLTTSNVMMIKRMLKRNKSLAYIARRFNVSATQIKRIQTGENWGHISATNT